MPRDDLLANVLQQYDTPVAPPKENTPANITIPEMQEQGAEEFQVPQMESQQINPFTPPQMESQQIRPLYLPEVPQTTMPVPEFPQATNNDELQGAVELNTPDFPAQAQNIPIWTPPKTVPFGIEPIPKTKLNVPEETYKPQITTDDAYTDYNPIVWT